MTKKEFEAYAGTRICDADYAAIELVYLYHPAVEDKNAIALIWVMGGRALIEEMTPRAEYVKRTEEEVNALRNELAKAEKRLTDARSGDICSRC